MIILLREALNRDKYQKKILLPSLKLLSVKKKQSRLGHVFQQGMSFSKTIVRYIAGLRRKHVQAMDDWPAKSPDLNVIETVWAWLAGRCGSRAVWRGSAGTVCEGGVLRVPAGATGCSGGWI